MTYILPRPKQKVWGETYRSVQKEPSANQAAKSSARATLAGNRPRRIERLTWDC